jgi:hypothetical protein
MRTIYESALKAHVSLDAENRVRHIRHSQEYWPGADNVPRLSAQAYLHAWADTLQIPHGQLGNLSKKVSFLDPREQGAEYHLHEEKHLFDGITVGSKVKKVCVKKVSVDIELDNDCGCA